ncbi:Uncharacterized protein GBIM_09091 [Gryllus bimaculatus]|nr:Uncharacterized protein GBIM_09091 [Gryllus bimaculatus]
MTKIRKQKRKKRFRYPSSKNLKRKKVMRDANKHTKFFPCKEMKNDWESNKSVITNMEEMGLVYDVNKALGIPSNKQAALESTTSGKKKKKKLLPRKAHVVQKLEENANAPRVGKFRLPEGQVRWLSYLITKYGEDYKAMSRDPKNHYAETWKQIRAKINTFKKIPEQYDVFLKSQENHAMDTSTEN